MKIEVIEENRIQVILTRSELAERNLNKDNLKRNSPHLNEFLFEVMEHIREETDFNPYSGQVVIEASPDGEGLMLIISKIVPGKKNLTKADKDKYRKAKPVIKNIKKKKSVYIFENFEDLCSAVVRLDKRGFENSTLYRIGDKFYYYLTQGDGYEKSNAVLCEYSVRNGMICSKAYLEEHGEVVFDADELRIMALNLTENSNFE